MDRSQTDCFLFVKSFLYEKEQQFDSGINQVIVRDGHKAPTSNFTPVLAGETVPSSTNTVSTCSTVTLPTGTLQPVNRTAIGETTNYTAESVRTMTIPVGV